MPISDKNRKILWARSGNRCAICRLPLVVEQTAKDSESVIAAECHIIAALKKMLLRFLNNQHFNRHIRGNKFKAELV